MVRRHPSMRASRVGPISVMVTRTGRPSFPHRSQNTTGLASARQSSMPMTETRSSMRPDNPQRASLTAPRDVI